MGMIEKQEAIDALKAIKYGLWEIDIPSPGNCLEYIEHHKQIKDMMEITDGWIKKLMKLPSAQPETAKRMVGKSKDGMTLWYQCNICNEPVDAQDNFCRGCGRRLTDG